MKDSYDEVAAFHGHSCPGLAIGYRMTLAALAALDTDRSKDEEMVAVVENNACGVDALQYLAGCTFGKGNLVFDDYGKNVYTLFCRERGKGVRVAFKWEAIPEALWERGEELTRWLLEVPEEELLEVREAEIPEPEPARIIETVRCSICGESVMATRSRDTGGARVCIPCTAEKEKHRKSDRGGADG